MTEFHAMAGATGAVPRIAVRTITLRDLGDALEKGLDDFLAKPSHYAFLCIIYPLIGVFMIAWSAGNNIAHLVFPLMSGFALIGPFAALGLYEISRRRELGMDTSWRHALDVRTSPALPAIAVVGIMLLVLFVIWLLAAQAIYHEFYGAQTPASLTDFLRDVLATERGHELILWGNLAGFCFALVVLSTTVVAFPLLVDRDVGAVAAVETSIRAVATNPVPMIIWGLIVSALLVIGALPLFAGLAVVMPILGHATWHLYRKTVVSG